MATCDHITWLRLSGSEDITLHDEGRLGRLLKEFSNPEIQRPSLLFFLGHKAKITALRELFPYNNIKRGRQDGIANLRLDHSTSCSDYPILFADSSSASRPVPQRMNNLCHEVRSYSITSEDNTISLIDFLHGRLLCLFSDVICIFAEDFASLESVVERLKTWARAGYPSDLSSRARPRVVIVVEGDDASPTYNLLQAQDLRFNLHQQELISFFSSISVLRLAHNQISPLARYRRLKESLLRHADEMRQLHQTARSLFSAVHLHRFFEDMVKQVAEGPRTYRNFLQISRRNNQVSVDYHTHLENFVRTCGGVLDHESVLTIIATSMLMDAYPPRMHGKISFPIPGSSVDQSTVFDPGLVYDQIYQAPWLKAINASGKTANKIKYRSRPLKELFVSKFNFMVEHYIPAATIHFRSLRDAGPVWKGLRSNRTCFSCIRRMPETVLSCGHAFCDICIRLFGIPVAGFEYRYKLKRCTLCGLGSVEKMFRPPTAGARILSVDGGGVRGVVPLEFLGMLQHAIGAACPIQDLFDLALGTSSGMSSREVNAMAIFTKLIGGLIVLGLFLRRWSIDQCSNIFDALTKQFFRREKSSSTGIMKRVRRVIKCWISDGCYEVEELEAALRQKFGEQQKVFDHTSHPASTKVAVTATLISDAFPVLFSNYNGTMARSKNCGKLHDRPSLEILTICPGYKHLRPSNVDDETCVWEA